MSSWGETGLPKAGLRLGALCMLATLLAACTQESDSGADVEPSNSHVEVSSLSTLDPDRVGHYSLGTAATVEEIAGWDIDINPQGEGLPPGSGSVEDGEVLYDDQCSECHGSFGEGVGRFPVLSGGEDSLTDPRPMKTIGSYWKYTSTLWDYIHRAMPFLQPESLTDDEVYALTAYVLYLNDLVDADFVLTQENLTSIRLPNEANFMADSRPDTTNTRCMNDCLDPASINIITEAAPMDDSGNPISAEQALALAALRRAPTAEADSVSVGAKVYQDYCELCHANGSGGAPVIGDTMDWQARMDGGDELLIAHALDGFTGTTGVMLPKGGFSHLSDEEVIAAVHHMMEAI